MSSVRAPVYAGSFYPNDTESLRTLVRDLLRCAPALEAPAQTLRGIVAPHAGYVYSGATAACAYAYAKERVEPSRIVLLGPSHQVAFHGLALSRAEIFATPLGDVPIDHELGERILSLDSVHFREDAHAEEHSLEVHLPFVQESFGDVPVLPIVVGQTAPDEVCAALELLWDEPGVFFIFSTDLSHFHDDATAREIDEATALRISSAQSVEPEEACGCRGLNALSLLAQRRKLDIRRLALDNSSSASGRIDRVVGYGAFAVHETS